MTKKTSVRRGIELRDATHGTIFVAPYGQYVTVLLQRDKYQQRYQSGWVADADGDTVGKFGNEGDKWDSEEAAVAWCLKSVR